MKPIRNLLILTFIVGSSFAPITKQIHKNKPKEKHKHTVHCCKKGILMSTYHTYIRVDSGINHPDWCRCHRTNKKLANNK